MNVSIGDRWEGFVSEVARSGRHSSASEVIREGLRLVEEREAKLAALRNTINAAIAEGNPATDEDLTQELDAKMAELAKAAD